MSGKQDKASRRLTASVDEEMSKFLKNADEAVKIDKAKLIVEFLYLQKTMPFWERLKLAISVLFIKYWWAVKGIFMTREKS